MVGDGKLKIAILLTCHNRKSVTLQCMKNVCKCWNCVHQFDFWVVDDGCTDGTAEGIRGLNLGCCVNLVQGSGHDYWAGGMRRAWNAAIESGTDYDGYLWLNDDTMLFPSALETLVRPVGTAGIVVGVVSDLVGKTMTYGGRARDMRPVPIDGTYRDVQTFDGNCVLVSRSAFEKIGGMSDYVTHAIGDNDYGLRATEAGIRIVQTPCFVGTCEKSDYKPDWTKSSVPLIKRIRNLYSPLGYSQAQVYFHFNRIHFGVFHAVRLWIHQHIRVLFPWIWERFK